MEGSQDWGRVRGDSWDTVGGGVKCLGAAAREVFGTLKTEGYTSHKKDFGVLL